MANSVCRLCTSESDLSSTIYDDDICFQITETTGLLLSLENKGNLPVTLCSTCVHKVQDFYVFRLHCWEVQQRLEQLYTKDALDERSACAEQEDQVTEMQIEVLAENQAEVRYEIEIINDYEECELLSEDNPETITSNVDGSDSVSELEPVSEIKPDAKSDPFRTRKRGVRDEKQIYQSLLLACEICGKMVERNRMEGHRNRHQNVRPYKCTNAECDSLFYCQVSRRLHCRNKHSSQVYQCEVCNKYCHSKKALYIHKREVHTARNFECLVCGLAFVSNGRRKRHMDVHSNIKKYNCQYCPKAFHRNNNLQVHLRTHTKEKPYTCQLCPKAFGYVNLLKSHVARKHNNDSDAMSTEVRE